MSEKEIKVVLLFLLLSMLLLPQILLSLKLIRKKVFIKITKTHITINSLRSAKIKVKDINKLVIKELGISTLITYPDLIISLNKYSKSKFMVTKIPAILFSILVRKIH